jgi:hypothetical protein
LLAETRTGQQQLQRREVVLQTLGELNVVLLVEANAVDPDTHDTHLARCFLGPHRRGYDADLAFMASCSRL